MTQLNPNTIAINPVPLRGIKATVIEWGWVWYEELCRPRRVYYWPNSLRDLKHNSGLHVIRKPNSIIISLFSRNISKFLTSLPPRRLKVMFCYSWICPFSFCQKFMSSWVCRVHQFRFFTTLISVTTLVSVTTLAGLTTLVTVTLTLVHCCSSSLVSRHRAINLVSKQMYHWIDVILLASSEYVTLIHLLGKPEFPG